MLQWIYLLFQARDLGSFLKVIVKLLVSVLLAASAISAVPAAHAGNNRTIHPLFDTEDEEGRPLTPGTLREMTTVHDMVLSGEATDIVVGPRGELFWISKCGDDDSKLAVLSPDGALNSVRTGVSLKKLAVDPANGKLWFLYQGLHGKAEPFCIGFFNLKSFSRSADQMVKFPVALPVRLADPAEVQRPVDIAVSSSGKVAIATDKKVVIFDGSVSKPCQGGGIYAVYEKANASLAFADNNDLWMKFVDNDNHQCGVITPQSTYREGYQCFFVPAGITAITPVHDRGVAFMRSPKYRDVGVLKKDASSGGIGHLEFALGERQFPGGLAMGPDNNLWISTLVGDSIAVKRIPDGKSLAEYQLQQGSWPTKIVPGPDGKIYFIESGTSRIGAITVIPKTRAEAARARMYQRPEVTSQNRAGVATAAAEWNPAEELEMAERQVREQRQEIEQHRAERRAVQVERQQYASRAYAEAMARQAEQRQERLEAKRAEREARAAAQAEATASAQHAQVADEVQAAAARAAEADSDSGSEEAATELSAKDLTSVVRSVCWDHIQAGHFATSDSRGGTATASANSSTAAEWPKSRFTPELSTFDALSGLLHASLSSGYRGVYDPDGRTVVSHTFPQSIGQCFNPATHRWHSTQHLKVVLSEDRTVVTAYPVLKPL